MTMKAVLTGDLIHSQTADDTQAYLEGLQKILATLAQHYALEADTYRGDGFQISLHDTRHAFECALALRAGLIAASPKGERWDARIALGIGPDTSGRDYGEAYVLSGQGLDGMKKLTLGVFCNDVSFMSRAELVTEFAAAILDKWTVVEAQAYYAHVLGTGDQQSIASQLGKSRVAINKALQRGQARLLDRYLASSRQWLAEVAADA
jgi:class 3 adenylate cyclase